MVERTQGVDPAAAQDNTAFDEAFNVAFEGVLTTTALNLMSLHMQNQQEVVKRQKEAENERKSQDGA
jgi:hypothetical protein